MDPLHSSMADAPHARLRQHRREVAIATARSVAAAVLLLVGYFLAPIGATASWSGSVLVRSTIALGLLLLVVTLQTIAVARSATPALRAIEALGISVSMLLVTSAAVYLLISGNDAEAFTEPLEHVDALYLSMMTMTTVGFGDIGALSQGARIAVMAQLVVNVIVLGVAVRVVLLRARAGADRATSHD